MKYIDMHCDTLAENGTGMVRTGKNAGAFRAFAHDV